MTTSSVRARPIWADAPSPALRVLKAVALTVVVAVIAFPFLVVVSTSLASEQQLVANGGYVLWPSDPSFDAYRQVLGGGAVSRAVIVSVAVTVIGTAISLGATVLAAYALSQRRLVGKRLLLGVVLLTFLISPGIIPLYLMVKQLGLLNNYAALILPTAISAFNIVIMRGFFMTIPRELLDSAMLDGAGHWTMLRRIVLPLSKAVTAVVGMFYAVGYWNSFFNALLYLNDSAKWPLQLVLRTYVLQGSPIAKEAGASADVLPPTQALQMAVVVIAIVPIACVYPFLQKHFKTGVLTGAVKG
ncbi:carbohydrate ABC transporter permease [Luteipulveratus mongoliensis]|uniref:ABC transporter permease n=1 Tax=Luteipulveratus mongoliensis TaxID=571913 RepID=A0A0K1JEZ9_9MICO|nr:carbohydrate ABC transporter permease [Luteipulveratus mongoliensis]AKU15292.1 ABC transporter permease [Luteipulveratus mongoliensis]